MPARANLSSPALQQFARLQVAADLFNRELFAGTLPPVFITMVNKPGCYGVFSPNRYVNREGLEIDQIGLDATTAIERPLAELLSTLVHEQCHQAVYEQSGRQSSGGHGPQWRSLMESVGLPPVRIGTSWKAATHQIDPAGRFAQVVEAHAAVLKELPWQEASRSAASGKGTGVDRVRFQCPSCAALAWARPAAELLCGTCSTTERLVAMIPEVAPGAAGGAAGGRDPQPPTRTPGLPVFTDEMGRELRIHTGIDHPPTTPDEAITVMLFGLEQRGYGDLHRELADLKQIWKVRARQLHPDAGGSEVAFKSLQIAYRILEKVGSRAG